MYKNILEKQDATDHAELELPSIATNYLQYNSEKLSWLFLMIQVWIYLCFVTYKLLFVKKISFEV